MGESGGATVVRRKTSMSMSPPRSSWIQLDGSSGHASFLDIGKYDIMHRLHIDARDLRILDPLLSYPSTIFSRHNAIVLNLEHIKAIITAREVFVQDPTDENVVPVVEELQRRLPMPVAHTNQGDGQDISADGQPDAEAAEEDGNAESPFEFRALEIVLEAVCSFLAARTTELEMATYPALDELTSKTCSRNLERVRKLKSAMTRLTARVQKVRDELEQLMDDDDDMADLYLSRKLAGASSSIIGFGASPIAEYEITKASMATFLGDGDDVEELEMLLEAYFIQIDDTLNKLITLRGYIDDTEDYINIQIDNHRNQLIQLELFLKTAEMSLSFYALVAAIFGTNFPYAWRENHGYLFKWVVIFSGLASAVMFLGTIGYARKMGVIGR